MSIREQIEYALVKAHMSNEDIAQALDVPVLVVNRIESELGLNYDL